ESSYRVMKRESSDQIGNSKGSAMVQQAHITIPLFRKVNENNQPTSWAINVSGTYANLNNKNFKKPMVIAEIFDLGLSLKHLRPLSKRLSMLATVRIGSYMPSTNISEIVFKKILGSVGAVFIHPVNPNPEIGGGLMLNNAFGYHIVYP